MKTQLIRSRAFTLVEVLVVITIIAVLAALLIPALASAKDRAKAAKCAHNQKQIGGAFTSYLNDHSGFYPYIYPECYVDNSPNGAAYSCPTGPDRLAFACTNGCGSGAYCYNSAGWNFMLATYFGYATNLLADWSFRSFCGQGGPPCSACNFNPDIQRTVKAYGPQLQCPANPWSIRVYCDPGLVAYPGVFGGGFVQSTFRLVATSYAMNGNMVPVSFRFAAPCTNNANWFKRVNMADISNPSSVALMGEMPWCNWAIPSPPNVWLPATTLPGQYYMTAAVVSNVGAAFQWQKPTPNSICNGYVAAWHGQSMNVLYPDGHVAPIKQPDLYNYASQFIKGSGTNGTPGAIFWGDGKLTSWYKDQFPGYSYPN